LIPYPVAALDGVTVLVTRPHAQANALCERIAALGGEALVLPAIAIEPMTVAPVQKTYDWVVFVSVNAVRLGLPWIARGPRTRVAAIGKATAEALTASKVTVDAQPEKDFTSEALLSHAALTQVAGQDILIVKGAGGRDLLQKTLTERGANVATLDVYRRSPPSVDAASIERIEQRWRETGIDIVTLTSTDTLTNLLAMLSESGRKLLAITPFVTLSPRIAAVAREHGLTGHCVLSRDADDALVGAIAAWHARAR